MIRKTKVYTVREFLAGKHRAEDERLGARVDKALKYIYPLATLTGLATPSYANGLDAKTVDGIMHALDPLTDFLRELSLPIAGVMVVGGCLFIMIGGSLRDKGVDMIKNACIGYILVQLSPLFIRLLVSVGTAVIPQ